MNRMARRPFRRSSRGQPDTAPPEAGDRLRPAGTAPGATGPAAVVARWTPPRMGPTLTIVDLDRPAWSLERCRALLDDGERAAADKLAVAALAARYTVRRAAVRHLLGDQTGLDPAGLRYRTGADGKLFLQPQGSGPDEVAFNVSHSRNVCVIAVGTGVAIGVDVQHIEERPLTPELLDIVLGPAEQARLRRGGGGGRTLEFTRAWTRKEAMLKAIGVGLTVPATGLQVDLTAAWRTARWPAGADYPDRRRCTWADLSDAQPGVCLALMVIRPTLGDRPAR
jgi:4'-phosphopantetheinyl transferase